MNKIEKIRQEIERLKETHERNLDKPMERGRIGYAHGCVDCCDRILSFIDSLPEETGEGLEKEIEKYYYDNFAFISSAHTPTKDIVSDIANHFYELGQRDAANKFDEIEYNRQRAEEEMSDKTLDEAVTTQMEEDGDVDYFVRKGIDDIALKYAKLGAKWMAGQGSIKDGVVTEDNDFIKFDDGTYIDLCPDLASKAFDLKNGDQVIVQIKKKEESK